MMKLLFFTLTFLIVSCTCPDVSKETFVRDTTYIVQPPVIIGGGVAQVVTDTLIQFIKVNEHNYPDTVVKLRYYPLTNIFDYKVKPDSIKIMVRDTLIKYQKVETIVEYGFFKKVGLFGLGVGVGLIALILLAQYNTIKKQNNVV